MKNRTKKIYNNFTTKGLTLLIIVLLGIISIIIKNLELFLNKIYAFVNNEIFSKHFLVISFVGILIVSFKWYKQKRL